MGAGKTTLVEQLWSQLDRRTYVLGRVVTTQVSGDDLLRLIVTSYGLDDGGANKASLLRRFEKMVREQRAAGRRCLLVVDEVQNLSVAALEELRMLSNITVDGRASVQTILLGQPQFKPMLASLDLEQLRQRVLASYHFGPLTEQETRGYSSTGCARSAGWTIRIGKKPPSRWCIAIPTASRAGSTRCAPASCSTVLWKNQHTINAGTVSTIATELEQDLGSTGAPLRPAGAGNGAPGNHPVSNGVMNDGVLGNGANGILGEGLLRRIGALEQGIARQDRIFRRLMDLLGGYNAVSK